MTTAGPGTPGPPDGGPPWGPGRPGPAGGPAKGQAPDDPDRPAWLPPPPPVAPPPRPGRGPLLVVLVLLLVLGLAGAGLALTGRGDRPARPAAATGSTAPGTTATTRPGPSGGRAAAPPTPAAVRAVQADVADLRGLRFERRVPVTIEPPARLARRLGALVREETDERDLAHQGRALELLGELPAGTDLSRLLETVQAESVLGFYVPGKPPRGRLYVRSSRGLDPYARIVLAHELTHAVTDQHYDLTRGDRLAAAGQDDQQVAFSALVEGDATYVMQRYLTERLAGAEQAEAGRVAIAQRTPRRDAAPPAIRESLLFPYQAGLTFVRTLYQQGGAPAVDRAYRDPPVSTEQILHPSKYLGRRDLPQPVTVPDLAARLGPGWRPGADVGFGEFEARLLLLGELPVTVAEDAAAGWDGGRLRTFERGGRTALVLRTAWDAASEADRYCQATSRWATARLGPGRRAADGTARWSGRSQQGALLCRGTRVAWLSAPDRASLDSLVVGLGRP